MDDWVKSIIRTLVLDTLLAAFAIICYSPGFLGLRPSNSSILGAGLSILLVPVILFLFYVINVNLLRQKSIRMIDGKRVAVSASDGDILNDIDNLNAQIRQSELLNKSLTCRHILGDIFFRAEDDTNDLSISIIRNKLDYYINVYKDTLNRELTMEKYSNTTIYEKTYDEISSTLDLLQEVFLKALDQMLGNTLNDAELDKIVLQRMMNADGMSDSPFKKLVDKYN